MPCNWFRSNLDNQEGYLQWKRGKKTLFGGLTSFFGEFLGFGLFVPTLRLNIHVIYKMQIRFIHWPPLLIPYFRECNYLVFGEPSVLHLIIFYVSGSLCLTARAPSREFTATWTPSLSSTTLLWGTWKTFRPPSVMPSDSGSSWSAPSSSLS